MANRREILEGRQEQGAEEEITYTLTVPATWGTPTGTPTVKAYTYSVDVGYTDVTATVIPAGSASVNGQVITLPEIKSLSDGVYYRIEIKFNTTEGDVKEAFAWLDGVR